MAFLMTARQCAWSIHGSLPECPPIGPVSTSHKREAYSCVSYTGSTILPSCTPTASGKRFAPELSIAAPLDDHHDLPFYSTRRSGKTNMWVPKQCVAHTLRFTICDLPL